MGSAGEHPELISHKIIFEEFQLCDHDTSSPKRHRQTDDLP